MAHPLTYVASLHLKSRVDFVDLVDIVFFRVDVGRQNERLPVYKDIHAFCSRYVMSILECR